MPHLKKLAALALVLPFTAGAAYAQQDNTAPPADPAQETALPATLDTNNDGKADAWDRDSNGAPDAWDTNGDGKPDKVDNDGDGKADSSN